MNKYEKAIKHFETAIKIKTDYLDASKNLDVAKYKLKELENINHSWKNRISKFPEKGFFILNEFDNRGFFQIVILIKLKMGKINCHY